MGELNQALRDTGRQRDWDLAPLTVPAIPQPDKDAAMDFYISAMFGGLLENIQYIRKEESKYIYHELGDVAAVRGGRILTGAQLISSDRRGRPVLHPVENTVSRETGNARWYFFYGVGYHGDNFKITRIGESSFTVEHKDRNSVHFYPWLPSSSGGSREPLAYGFSLNLRANVEQSFWLHFNRIPAERINEKMRLDFSVWDSKNEITPNIRIISASEFIKPEESRQYSVNWYRFSDPQAGGWMFTQTESRSDYEGRFFFLI